MKIAEKTEWFIIEADPRTRHVRMTLNGLWNEATLGRFEQAIASVIGKLVAAGAPAGTYRTLIDLRNQGLMTQTVAELSKGLATGPGAASERIAVVVANTLQKLQQNRVSPVGYLRVFQDHAEAEGWVFANDDHKT